MNFANEDQLIAVGQSCRDFEPRAQGFISSTRSAAAENISCEACKYWSGTRCIINVFDKVLTSLDQT